jgi:cell wall-associated NlpC family hydrolase
MTGIADVQARISDIQSRIAALDPGAVGVIPDQTPTMSFQSALDSAQAAAAGPSKSLLGDGSANIDTGGPTGADVVSDARKYLGVPYVFGGTNPKTGLDCSGLVQRVYKDLGISLPRLVRDQMHKGTAVPNLAAAKPGDLLVFGGHEHIAIYIGNNKMIAAPEPGDHVKVQSVYEKPSSIRRIVDTPAPTLSGASQSLTAQGVSSGSGAIAKSVPYADLFTAAARRHGLPPALLAAVAKCESNYNTRAVSSAGAEGMMQFMPATARGLGIDPYNPAQAIEGAARKLSSDLHSFGSVKLALAAYNAGGGAVRKYGGIPPFSETQAYVPRVLNAMSALERGASR